MTNQLAANSIDGVYVCESGTKEVLRDQDFYDALATCSESTIYGQVSDEWADKISKDYGIH